ncbi:MAG: flagellar biosynthetic protein FliR [Thermacetogeniaceae bacterium]
MSYVFQYGDLYFLIFGRVAGFFLTAIPFSSRNFLVQLKIWLAAIFSYLIFMVYPRGTISVSANIFGYLIQFAGEFLVGAIMGFLTQITFAIFQFAGQMLDMQIGFGIVNVIDPQSGIQAPILGNFKNLLALLFFLTINGHHYLLRALERSYAYIPIGTVHIKGGLCSFIFSVAGEMFASAFKIALPVIASLFIADLAMGVIARTVPQINVFLVGLPLKIGIGLWVLLMLMPLLVWIFSGVFASLFDDLSKLLFIMRR